MSRLKCVDEMLSEFSNRTPVRAGSLIISLFGDSISQHGNTVWLGSIIEALSPFGLNARQIRTAVFRLVKENWLQSTQIGRKSYYSFTEFGSRHYEKAARRVYNSQSEEWDGNWTVVIPALVSTETRDELRKELIWLGYGAIATGVMAHPSGNRQSLDETLMELGITESVVVLKASTEELSSRSCLKQLVNTSWDLDAVQARYESFLAQFRPLMSAIKKVKQIGPQECFLIRTLLIHEYRRILLNDADLPEELLPINWPGKTAFDLTNKLYRTVQAGAVKYLTSEMECVDGLLPAAGNKYYSRFAGLTD